MNILRKLWTDQAGAVMSAEMVTLGTIGVLASAVGLGLLTNAINDELAEVAMEMRGFDQGVTAVYPSTAQTAGIANSAPAPASVTTASGAPLNPAQQAVLREYQEIRKTSQIGMQSQAALQASADGTILVDTPDGRFEIRRVSDD